MCRWIKLDEKILEWEWFNDAYVVKAWLWMLLQANFKDKKWRGRVIKRGQFLTSKRHMADYLGVSDKTAWNIMHKLEETGEISMTTDKKWGTLITICKYEDYQSSGVEDTPLPTPPPTPLSTPLPTPPPTPNIRIIERKEYNNNIIGEKKTRTTFKPPTLDEVQEYISAKGYNVDAIKFWNYYDSNGWMVGKNKMKKWESAIVTWNRNQYGNSSKPSGKRNIYDELCADISTNMLRRANEGAENKTELPDVLPF